MDSEEITEGHNDKPKTDRQEQTKVLIPQLSPLLHVILG